MRLLITILLLIAFSMVTKAQDYFNYAAGKPVITSWDSKSAMRITDGYITTVGGVRLIQDEQFIEIDLTAEFLIGGAHLFLDTRNIMPLDNFVFQYRKDEQWIDIPGAAFTNNYKTRIRIVFDSQLSTSAIRMTFNSSGKFGIAELQIWGEKVPGIPYGVDIEDAKPFEAEKHWICVNQVAYNLDAPKFFTVPTAKSNLIFEIIEEESGKVVFKGRLINKKGDFSDFNPKEPLRSEYSIRLSGDGLPDAESFPFRIGNHAIQEMAYQSAVDFMNDSRSMVGTHSSAYGGSPWRDGTYYTYEVPSMVMLYLSNPEIFEKMEVTMDWEKEKDLVFADNFQPTKEPNDRYALETVRRYYTEIPRPKSNAPDLLQCIQYGIGWFLLQPVTADPSGDPEGWKMHGQTIEQFAYFLYAYPKFEQYIEKSLYNRVLDSTLIWWDKAGLFDLITKVGGGKGRHCPGHSILPNLLMYEVAKRERLSVTSKFLMAAQNMTRWIIDEADWNDPRFMKGQRMSEQKLVTGLSLFQLNYPNEVPGGLKQKLEEWAEVVVTHSHNMWDFRRFDMDENWTLPGFNEAGNIIGFPACALGVAMTLQEGKLKERLVALGYSHFDNMYGRNPLNAHCANHADLGLMGVDSGWPYRFRYDVCARLETVRGSLSSLPGTEMYPFNPNGKPRHPEGWTPYNACWNVSLTFLNFYENFSDFKVFKNLD